MKNNPKTRKENVSKATRGKSTPKRSTFKQKGVLIKFERFLINMHDESGSESNGLKDASVSEKSNRGINKKIAVTEKNVVVQPRTFPKYSLGKYDSRRGSRNPSAQSTELENGHYAPEQSRSHNRRDSNRGSAILVRECSKPVSRSNTSIACTVQYSKQDLITIRESMVPIGITSDLMYGN